MAFDPTDDKVRVPPNSQWEDTPKWMFWKLTRRRIVIRPRRGCYGGCCSTSLYEYQHPAFVAREILEEQYGQRSAPASR